MALLRESQPPALASRRPNIEPIKSLDSPLLRAISSGMAEAPKLPKNPQRKSRLAQALKTNLKRRKAQAKARQTEKPPGPDKPA
ncbi:MAG: hypothetical protein AB7F76_03980 [Parvibaculaceae bacterium]